MDEKHVKTPKMTWWVPTVIEETHRGEREWTVFSRLLKDRIIFLGWPIDDNLASVVIAQLLFLESEDPEKDIYLYINSPGGYVHSALAIYDTMQYVRCPISTLAIGQAASMAALLLAAGTKGRRFALPHARFLLHQPLGSFSGQAEDVEIRAKEILYVKRLIVDLFAKHTSQAPDKIAKDFDRDFYLGAQEAKDYGLIDEVIERRG
jgi:ATP-dependent Clp protease protease subunit